MKQKLSKLLLDTPEAYYWMGFLMADGTFVGNRLKIGLSIKDDDLLNRLYEFLECDNTIHTNDIKCEFSVMDSHSVPLLRDKFNIKSKKTYNPPKSLLWMKDDLLYSFIIGFIDGDGSIGKQYGREDCILRIKVHSNWLGILNEISEFISKKANVGTVKARINNQGYANINLGNHILLKSIKLKAKQLNVPYLNRKWSLINESHINKMEISKKQLRQLMYAINFEINDPNIQFNIDEIKMCLDKALISYEEEDE